MTRSVRLMVGRLVCWIVPKTAGSYTSMILSEHFLLLAGEEGDRVEAGGGGEEETAGAGTVNLPGE